MKRHLIQPTTLRKGLLSLAVVLTAALGSNVHAQQKVNDGTVPAAAINASAIAEYQTNNKGILLPRVQLVATTNAAPLGAHVAGMKVYNTATAGIAPSNVTPGEYYNDGTQWVRLAVVSANTNLYGSGAPTGGCSPATLYTDTLTSSPTVGQQWTCSNGNWIPYIAPPATEWMISGSSNDAGSNKEVAIYRSGPVGINTYPRYILDVAHGAVDNIAQFRSYRPNGKTVVNIAGGTTNNWPSLQFGQGTNIYMDSYLENATTMHWATQLANGKFIFEGTGGAQLGINSNPAYALQVAGTCAATAFVTTSDARFKKDIQTYKADALDKIMTLSPKTYTYKSDEEIKAMKGITAKDSIAWKRSFGLPEGTQFGFIAQDVEKVLPQLVATGTDGYKAVDYGHLTPILVAAIQEMKAGYDKQIAELKAAIEVLKKK